MLTLLTWIVIAFIICIIFGVIKVEDVKAFAAKWTPKAQEALSQAKTIAEKKAAELKEAAEKKQEAHHNEAKEETKEESKDSSAE